MMRMVGSKWAECKSRSPRRGHPWPSSLFYRSGALALLILLAALTCPAQTNVLTYKYDNNRSGLNANENFLTPSNVNSTQFGKLFSVAVDGYVYAQPLYLPNVTVLNQGVHNVVYAATEHDSVYAIDADSGAILWQVSFLNPAAGVSTVSQADISCGDLVPEAGITSTPVIDPAAGTIFLVARTKENGTFVQRLHALDVTSGLERPGSPVPITASVSGTGDGTSGGSISFNSLTENSRTGLLLQNGHVVIAWASVCDNGPYHGWVMSYNAGSLAQEAVLNTTPNGGLGGIWMSGGGIAADSSNIYFSMGNGTYDGITNFGDSVLKVGPPASNSFPVLDWFTPHDQTTLSGADLDVGSAGVLLLPDQSAGSPHLHLLVTAGKNGTIYLIDRDNMGHFNSSNDSQIVQSLPGAFAGVWSTQAWWNNTVYFGPSNLSNGDSLKAYPFNTTTGTLSSSSSSHSSTLFKFPGTSPSVSASGTSNGVVWTLQTDNFATSGAAVLHSYDATNLATELYNSSQNAARDNPGPAVKFSVPTVINGKVYVGTQNQLSIFGLLTPTAATPTFSLPGGTYNTQLSVSLSDSTAGAVIYYTTDGTTPTTLSTQYVGSISVAQAMTIKAIATHAGLANSLVATATYVLQVAMPTFNPVGGTIASSQPIAISDGTPGAVIYYTTDGTTPIVTLAEQYAGPFTLSASAVVRAIASASGFANSAVSSTSYTVAGTPPALVSLVVTPANPSIIKGVTQQFTATGTYSDNSTQNLTSSVTWTSTNTAVATISGAGLATGVAAGNVSIQATSGSISGSTGLTVTSLPPGLVGHWTFDDGSGTTAADSSGNGLTATLVNGVAWAIGKIGGAISANGANQYGSIPAINLSATSAVTVALWVNRTYSTVGGHTLLEASTNYNNSTTGFGLFPDDASCNGIQASVRGNVGYSVNCYAQPSSGVWHHLVVVYDKTQPGNNEVNLYIDGVLQTPIRNWFTSNNTNAFGNNPIYLFSRGGTQGFNAGTMDDLQIYNRSLSASEIQQIYSQGSGAALVSLAVTPANPSIAKGTTQQFTATGTFSDNSTQNLTGSVTWTSTSTAVATITSAGLASGVATGGTTIQAASGSISGSTSLTVTPAVLASIAVTPANPSIAKGATQQFIATGTYSDGSTQNLTGSVTWTSTSTAVATITSGGLASGVAAGTTTIQATSGSISGSTTLTVLNAALASIAVTPANPSIAKGTTLQFTATGTYSDSTTQNLTNSVTWTSTNTAAATITNAGLATGAAVGSSTIQAVSGSINGSTSLTITPAVLSSIAVTPANPSIATSTTQQFTATGTYSDGSTQNLTGSVTWTSTNTAAATITNAGLATGVAVGSTTIQAVSGSVNGSTVLTVASSSIPGLTGYWTFDEGSGTTAADTSGKGHNVTLFNGISWITGKIGGAITANGVNQYVSTPAIDLSATSAVTVSLWVNRTYSTAGGHALFENSPNFNNSTTGFGLFPDDNTCNGIMAGVNGNVGYSINCYTQPSSGAWHHLVVIYDKSQPGSNEVSLYIDGVLQTPKQNYLTSNNTNNFGNNPIYLFSRGGTQEFAPGTVDELRIYNRALSASEIQQIYSGTGGATLVSLAVTPANPSIVKGTTQQFTATGTFSDSSTQNLTSSVIWASTNTAVATVTSAGLATSVAAGTTTIQATSGAISNSTGLTVTPPVLASIAVTPANPSIAPGATQQFTATGTFSDNSTQNLTNSATWASTNTNVATITSAGLASGAVAGTTTIQATSGSISGSTILTVATPPALVSIAVTPANASIAIGATQQFTATGTYSNNSTQNLTSSVTWTSTSTTVATITSAGLATAVAAGSTTIQATLGSISGSTGLTVTTLPAGLVGHWAFDDGAGTTAADSSGNGHTATLVNGITWTPGKIGGAISANGTTQYGSIPAINLGATSAVTVSLWVNRTYSTVGGHALFEATANYNASTTGFGVFPDDAGCNGIQASVHGNVGYSANCYTQPSSGVWHHLVVVYDKTQAGTNEVNLYIDGVLQTPTGNLATSNNTNAFGNNPIYLFSRGGTQEFASGTMDDLQIYNRVLSASEIQGLP